MPVVLVYTLLEQMPRVVSANI